MSVETFLEHLGVKAIRREGDNQLLCRCHVCGKDKLYVNRTTGLWKCFHGCGSGNAYKLAQTLTSLRPAEIMALLGKDGLNSGDRPAEAKQRPKKPRITKSEKQPAIKDEIEAFCKIKSIDPEAMKTVFGPLWRHVKHPWMLLPAHNPSNLSAGACGILRAALDGGMVKLASGREDKYPAIAGGGHGLFGAHWILERPKASLYEPLIFAEGWRDMIAAVMLGFYATASSGGASCWKDEWLPLFADRDVSIIFDRDNAGIVAARRAAAKMFDVVRSVKIVELPFELKESHGADLYDWLQGKSKGDLKRLLDGATNFEPPPEKTQAERIVLLNDHPDTVAETFEQWSIVECHVRHKYNSRDGWSILWQEKYQTVEDEKEIHVYLRRFLRCLYVRTWVGGRANGRWDELKYKTSNSRVKDIVSELAALVNVHIRPGLHAPASLDGTLNPKNIIAANNCLLDISSYPPKQLPLSAEFYTLNYLDIDYDTHANCPRWKKFLGEIFFLKELSAERTEFGDDGNWIEGYETRPDDNSIQLLQAFIGLLLSQETKYQKILGIVGPKRSGKGTIGRIIRKLVGCKNVVAPTLSSLTTEFGLYGLINKTVAIIGDASLGGRNQNTLAAVERLKTISGEDAVSIRRMRTTPLEVEKMPLRFVIMGNELQCLTDPTGALASRWLYVFTKKSFYGRENLDLEAKLTEELPGILNWALKGLHRLTKRGRFIEPPDSIRARQISEEIGSAVIAFAHECCIFEQDYQVRKADLWAAYRKWAEDAGRSSLGKHRFYKDFEAAFPDCPCSKIRPGISGTNPTWHFVGVGLTPEWQNVEAENGTN